MVADPAVGRRPSSRRPQSQDLPVHAALHRRRSSQSITRLVHPIVAFRYTPTMTVPGKGGRPRKWRSDADRVRAFRARHRGEEEPATFEEALVDGDDLARAVERSRQLQADLVTAMASLSESNLALQTESRRHQSTLRRLDRVRTELDGLRAARARREDELELLREGLAELRAENAALRARIALTAPATRPQGVNHADRRRAAKRDRYKD